MKKFTDWKLLEKWVHLHAYAQQLGRGNKIACRSLNNVYTELYWELRDKFEELDPTPEPEDAKVKPTLNEL